MEGAVADLLRTEGVAFEPAPSLRHVGAAGRTPLADAWALASLMLPLANFLRRRRVAIVHTNEAAMHATWAAPARLAGAKLLWHHRGGPESRGLKLLAPLLANRIVAVSEYAAPKSRALAAARKCSVVYSPFEVDGGAIDKAACRAALLEEIGEPADTQIVGFFGHLVLRKRPLIFVETIAEVRRLAPNSRVLGLVFGETLDPGADRELQARAERLGVADRVRMMGFRYPPERWLAGCDALLVPAVGEPFGRTLIEAMIVGTPVIAADSGGNPEAIRDGETGLLAPADDPLAFAERTLELLRQPAQRAVIAERAQATAINAFGVERHARSIHQIYRQLAFG
jgi:glycosyltransferase involved in cell wall biosynthesis